MKGKISAAAIHEPVDLRLLTEGEYPGMWHGRLVTARVVSANYWFACTHGPKDPAPCVVTVEKSGVSVRLRERRV